MGPLAPGSGNLRYLAPSKSAYGTPDTRFWGISDTWHQVKGHVGHLAPGFGVFKIPDIFLGGILRHYLRWHN